MYNQSKEELKKSVLSELEFQYNYEQNNCKFESIGYFIIEFVDMLVEKGKFDLDQANLFYDKAIKANSLYLSILEKIDENYNNIIEFENAQNMEFPCLCGEDERKIKRCLESIIITSRRILDIISPIFSQILFNKREDSFNKLIKNIKSKNDRKFSIVNEYIEIYSNSEISPYRLLCGVEKGRALRDKLIHQTDIRLDYDEYKENSEKEKLYIIINNSYYLYDVFILYFKMSFYHFVIEFVCIIQKIIINY